MNCRNCGFLIENDQKFCPNCGSPVNNYSMTNSANEYNNTNINNVFSNNFNIPSGVVNSSNVNVNKPSDIGFNNGVNSSSDILFSNTNNSVSKQDFNNSLHEVPKQSIEANTGLYMDLPDKNSKKGLLWLGVALVLVIIMVIGLVFVPIYNKQKLTVYETDEYKIEYNGNWVLDNSSEKMLLYYTDNNSRFLLNTVSTFDSLKFTIDDEADKQTLYKAFYDAWSKVDGGVLTGGTDTFLTLNDEAMYARVDYKMTARDNVGAFYVVVSQKNNKVISFMSYCNIDNSKKIDKDIMKMLNSLTYKSEAESSFYDEFKAGTVKKYTANGYMDYNIPDCWTLDHERTENAKNNSYIFKFKDGVSLLDVKGVTPYDSATDKMGTTYEAMKASAMKKYGVSEEKNININGVKWYVLVTPDYTSGGKSYHNEIYFAFSNNNTHLYYFEAYVSNETSKTKTSFFNESIEYILKSAKLYKMNE